MQNGHRRSDSIIGGLYQDFDFGQATLHHHHHHQYHERGQLPLHNQHSQTLGHHQLTKHIPHQLTMTGSASFQRQQQLQQQQLSSYYNRYSHHSDSRSSGLLIDRPECNSHYETPPGSSTLTGRLSYSDYNSVNTKSSIVDDDYFLSVSQDRQILKPIPVSEL